MNVLIFGGTGMVGQSALRECLSAPDVSQISMVGRTSLRQVHSKLQQLICADLFMSGKDVG
jgi:saccharopine dehydrogenase-like NADP-dependent oxidoreductase